MSKENYKKLNHVVMVTKESQDLQGDMTIWKPRKFDGLAHV